MTRPPHAQFVQSLVADAIHPDGTAVRRSPSALAAAAAWRRYARTCRRGAPAAERALAYQLAREADDRRDAA